MIYRLLIFLVLNFGALAIGGLFTRNGVSSDWYLGLNKAPWTPPGWVFGFAWSGIMVFFSFYMSYVWSESKSRNHLIIVYLVQWVLNVTWNPIFFYYQNTALGLIVITLLTCVILYYLLAHRTLLKLRSLFILPYLIWLIIATSLNVYILLYN